MHVIKTGGRCVIAVKDAHWFSLTVKPLQSVEWQLVPWVGTALKLMATSREQLNKGYNTSTTGSGMWRGLWSL